MLVIILLIVLSSIPHEFGHAFVYRRHNARIDSISILGITGVELYRFTWPRFFGKTPILIRSSILGGVIKPNDEDRKLLNAKQQMEASAGGVVAVMLYSGILYLLSCAVGGFGYTKMTLGCVLIILGLMPKITYRIVLPIGILSLCAVVYSLFSPEFQFMNIKTLENAFTQNRNLAEQISFGATLALIVSGFLQAMPLSYLDGGSLFTSFFGLSEKKSKIFYYITAVVLLLILLPGTFFDITFKIADWLIAAP